MVENGNRKAKEYNNNDQITFEDEYLSGKKLNGKSYDFKNCLIYVGQYSNGEISSGKGKKYDVNDILH